MVEAAGEFVKSPNPDTKGFTEQVDQTANAANGTNPRYRQGHIIKQSTPTDIAVPAIQIASTLKFGTFARNEIPAFRVKTKTNSARETATKRRRF
jgi:hypothetical protein